MTCPALPEATSFRDTKEEAREHGRKAVLQAIAARMNGFQEIPYLSVNHGSAVPLALSIKLQLYRELTAAGMTRANLQQVAGWPKTKADRMFDPNHESKLAQVETAF